MLRPRVRGKPEQSQDLGFTRDDWPKLKESGVWARCRVAEGSSLMPVFQSSRDSLSRLENFKLVGLIYVAIIKSSNLSGPSYGRRDEKEESQSRDRGPCNTDKSL